MTEKECLERIKDLRAAVNVYSRLLHDPCSSFFGCITIKKLIKKSNWELDRFQELIYNGELEDSLENDRRC